MIRLSWEQSGEPMHLISVNRPHVQAIQPKGNAGPRRIPIQPWEETHHVVPIRRQPARRVDLPTGKSRGGSGPWLRSGRTEQQTRERIVHEPYQVV